MEKQHTPGPWKYSSQVHFCGGAPYSESIYVTMGEETLTIGCHTGAQGQETIKANAKLVAAAPDLLEALETLLNVDEVNEHARCEAQQKALRAIEKATGPCS